MLKNKPILGISMGDPGGVGPEVCVKALEDASMYQISHPMVVGNALIIQNALQFCGLDLTVNAISDPKKGIYRHGTIDVYDMATFPAEELCLNQPSAAQGDASFQYVKANIEMALRKSIDATVTGPINKAALNLGGHNYAGHTEIYAHLTGTKDYAMMLCDGTFRVSHVSTHVSLRQACDRVKTDRILRVIELTVETLRKLDLQSPRIGVAGLNPHCGEGGLFGSEDMEEIMPAVAAAISQGIICEGPIPADTVFSKMRAKMYDAVVVMYHDQGHIPTKLMGFQFDEHTGEMGSMSGINVTLGLPVIRTSVDHGTAFEISGQGKANSQSMKEAIRMAALMVSGN